MLKLAVIDACGANFLSVEMALKRLKVDYKFTHNKDIINNADAVLLPGVGAAKFAMDSLKRYDLVQLIREYKKPLLGICLGMQLLYEYSEEGNVDCLGVIPGKVSKFSADNQLIIPHMGWQNMNFKTADQILAGIMPTDDVYFVHSYYVSLSQSTVASVSYGNEFTVLSHHNNFYGMQFHPEKSGKVGAKLLMNFMDVIISKC